MSNACLHSNNVIQINKVNHFITKKGNYILKKVSK